MPACTTKLDKRWMKGFKSWLFLRNPSDAGKDPGGKKTKEWCQTQRKVFRAGKLSVEREKLLKDNGFDFKEEKFKATSPRIAKRRGDGLRKSMREGDYWKKWMRGFVLYLHLQALKERGLSKEIPDEIRQKSRDWYGAQRRVFKKDKINTLDSAHFYRFLVLQTHGVTFQPELAETAENAELFESARSSVLLHLAEEVEAVAVAGEALLQLADSRGSGSPPVSPVLQPSGEAARSQFRPICKR